MRVLQRLSLRQMLTLPYVVLLLLAALVLGGLSYSTGRDTVDALSHRLIGETVGRIAQAVEKHVSGSEAVLETAFPNGMSGPPDLGAHVAELRTRFWLATSVHRGLNNYAYYGDRTGRFFGLWRHSAQEAELRLRLDPNGVRAIRRFVGIDGELQKPVMEQRLYEPRSRPWFQAGERSASQTWTSIYIDFKTLELVATRARRVLDGEGAFLGVVATDLSLQRLTDFLRTLTLSSNGVALIVEPDGNLIATSRGEHLRRGSGGENQRLNAAESDDALIASTWREVRALMTGASGQGVRTGLFEGPQAQEVQVGYASVRDSAGLDWIIAVAVPRSDFLGAITSSAKRSVALAAVMAGLIALLGFAVLSVLSRDLRRLAQVARKVGEGQLDLPLAVNRRDEIGELAQTLQTMQRRLHTDLLTGLANREAIVRRVEERLQQHRRRGDDRPFAVLFVDLNSFKPINDRFGHDVGDEVLRAMALRLRAHLRAEDMAARYAGDEFVVLLGALQMREDAQAARAHLEAALAQPWSADLPALPAGAAELLRGAAVGLALFPDDGQDVDSLIKAADADMYRRKRARAERG